MEPQIIPERVFERALFSERLVAFVVDLALFQIGYLLTLVALLAFGGAEARRWATTASAALWVFLYFASVTALTAGGQTPGKRLIGIRVISDDDGETPGLRQSLMRSVCSLASTLLMALGFLWALFHPRGLTWHDIAAGTIVVQARQKSPVARTFIRASAWGLAGFFTVSWLWTYLGAPSYARMQSLAARASR